MSLGLLILFLSFNFETTTDIHYDYMYFKRDGGGQINFKLYPTDNPNQLKAIVLRVNFRDTTIRTATIDRNSENDYAFAAFNKAITGQYEIDGEFDNEQLLTGSWAHIYFVTNDKEIEVKNKELSDKLLYFENVVRTKIGVK